MCIEEIGTPCEIPDSVPTNDDAQSRFYICTVNYQYTNNSFFIIYTTVEHVEEGEICRL